MVNCDVKSDILFIFFIQIFNSIFRGFDVSYCFHTVAIHMKLWTNFDSFMKVLWVFSYKKVVIFLIDAYENHLKLEIL